MFIWIIMIIDNTIIRYENKKTKSWFMLLRDLVSCLFRNKKKINDKQNQVLTFSLRVEANCLRVSIVRQ